MPHIPGHVVREVKRTVNDALKELSGGRRKRSPSRARNARQNLRALGRTFSSISEKMAFLRTRRRR